MRACGPKLAVVVLLSCVAVACSGSEQEASTIVVGSGNDVRDELVAEIYAGALRSVGAHVDTDTRIGDRADYLAALDRGDVDVVPDLTGELMTSFDSTSTATTADDVFVDLNKSLPAGLSVTDYATAEDRQAVAVASSGPFADATAVDDIVPGCGASTLVVADADIAAVDVLSAGYGCTFGSVTTVADGDAVVDAVADGSADVAVVRTASAGPGVKDLTALTDTDDVFAAQNVVPLFRDGVLSDSEVRSFSVVAGELTTADLADMIGEVRGGASSGDVAARWLGEHNL
ncbi:glycine betaine ABC transporter substrate-binding protein [Rhodococcoides kyotonense]|uniref:Osmoprotectant transport system substrate-binding protein n=1 Tax=Rhodococcoides kyotonense TaxID=398843 RepID=A0A239I325_9NOCA|nr:glycine betaine ABC transporter substrate-binding protein [Rhodococcus kyotonensis]SNS88015.1 osmoprotectant transport system substrate-binding protein [Rhodococcus kyotonensis]